MTEHQFLDYAQQGFNRIPVYQCLFADLDTALSIYLKLGNQPYTYLLESVVGGERFGRYSFIGLAANTLIKSHHGITEVIRNGQIIQTDTSHPLAFIENYQSQFTAPSIPELPRFHGGFVGYFGYDIVQFIEDKLGKINKPPHPADTPDILLMQSEELAIVDNLSGKLYLIVYANPHETNAYQNAQTRLQALRHALQQAVEIPYSLPKPTAKVEFEFAQDDFKQAVAKAKDYIRDGDIMQVVLSQRMHVGYDASPLSLYRALRSLNPSPYLFFYHFDDFHVVGASPEILVRREADTITLRPIAGTRPRGKDREEDELLAQELLSDPKEIAEHVMLMDLGRNDVGRVAQTGSVKITDKMVIERYSHVMHIVSSVEGEAKPDTSNMAILKATFPAGTLSGAAKVRAMEIIEELEPTKRGIYGGAVGYMGFSGDMDLAIAIRTAVIKNQTLYIQSGAGIVADSDLQAEWQETQNKAKAVLRAVELTQQGLDA